MKRKIAVLLMLIISWTSTMVSAQTVYQKPPREILDVLDAPANPLAVVAPTRDRMLLARPVRYPSIAEMAAPMLRLAGARINPSTSGPHRGTKLASLTLKRLPEGSETKVAIPPGAGLGMPVWAPDGKHFAVLNTLNDRVELWVGDGETGVLRRLPGVRINAAYGDPLQWMPDSRMLLCQLVPAGRGPAPQPPASPVGPTVQENYGKVTPAWTLQDLLKNAHDERLFEHYSTSQLALVDGLTGSKRLLGTPGLYSSVDPAPDAKHFLIERTKRPFSYLLAADSFPKDVEVWDRSGKVVHRLASLPLADQVPIEGVATGPRGYSWRPTEPATIFWVEALDGGDPRIKAVHRDRLLLLRAPFTGQPTEMARTEQRFSGLSWGESGGLALLRDYDRNRRWGRVFRVDANNPGAAPQLIWSRSMQDRYNDPGTPVMRRLPNGRMVIHQHGESIFLSGQGASPNGDRPFLDRFNLTTMKSERLFRCDEQSYESFVALLAPDGSRFLTSHETQQSPPNYHLRTAGSSDRVALTSFSDPTPQLRGISKQLVRYKRKDGDDLSFTLYLPPGYRQGTPLPTVVWAYPIEFSDAGVAGQVAGSTNRFTTISGYSHLFFLLRGYAVLDDATMPVIGDPETMNNTYIEQIVSSAQAAIDQAVGMGVTDRERVGVGGHSYGAFMTANLLAHSDIFRAGIARSGAYNRTLTPFGFQSERRTIWQAPQMYLRLSPFMYADKLKEPILLLHGEADNNAGTHPLQSDRMYQALKGNGGYVRYVTLPHESHGYAARESVEHALWEMIEWFDRHVREPRPTARN